MNRLAIWLVAAIGLCPTSGSAQQQQPQQHRAAQQHAKHVVMTAQQYEMVVQKGLSIMRAMRPVGPITQADINGGILLARDCATTVEADGVVTPAEYRYCSNLVGNYMNDKFHDVMLSGTPDQLAQWARQAQASVQPAVAAAYPR